MFGINVKAMPSTDLAAENRVKLALTTKPSCRLKEKVNILPFGSNASMLLYYTVTLVIFCGGAILLLLSGGFLSIQNSDPLNLILNEQTELGIFIAIGIALLASPLCLISYVKWIIRRKQAIKVGVNHHARNSAQEILLRLELLEGEVKTDEELETIRKVETSCVAMLDSLTSVIESDGDCLLAVQ